MEWVGELHTALGIGCTVRDTAQGSLLAGLGAYLRCQESHLGWLCATQLVLLLRPLPQLLEESVVSPVFPPGSATGTQDRWSGGNRPLACGPKRE